MKRAAFRIISLTGFLFIACLSAQADDGTTTADEKPATVAGTRGLNEPAETVDTAARDDAAIDRLEKQTVTPEELNQFIKEGHLP